MTFQKFRIIYAVCSHHAKSCFFYQGMGFYILINGRRCIFYCSMGHSPCLKHGIVLKGFYRTAAYGKQGGKKNGGEGYGNNRYDIPGLICTEGFIG